MQTYQILRNDDEVCIPSLSSILLAVIGSWNLQTRWDYLPIYKNGWDLCILSNFSLLIFGWSYWGIKELNPQSSGLEDGVLVISAIQLAT